MVLSYPVSTTDIEPIAFVDLSEEVYRLLRQKIFAREFPPRAKLDLDLLAKKLRVSRSPINKAVIRLAEEGLVRVEPRHGTFIMELSTRDIAETWDVRLALELLAAQQAIPHLGEDGLREPRRLLDQMARLGDDIGERYLDYVSLDREFHLSLVRLADNWKLLQVYEGLHTDVINARLYYHGRPRDRGEVGREHQRILAAYESRDLETVLKSVSDSVKTSQATLIRRLDELGGQV
jgi:GntR family transcriptional regulator, rspAB operon transcriptional repressor